MCWIYVSPISACRPPLQKEIHIQRPLKFHIFVDITVTLKVSESPIHIPPTYKSLCFEFIPVDNLLLSFPSRLQSTWRTTTIYGLAHLSKTPFKTQDVCVGKVGQGILYRSLCARAPRLTQVLLP